MPLIKGCQEGKGTPRLREVRCPRCGHVLPVGSYETEYGG